MSRSSRASVVSVERVRRSSGWNWSSRVTGWSSRSWRRSSRNLNRSWERRRLRRGWRRNSICCRIILCSNVSASWRRLGRCIVRLTRRSCRVTRRNCSSYMCRGRWRSNRRIRRSSLLLHFINRCFIRRSSCSNETTSRRRRNSNWENCGRHGINWRNFLSMSVVIINRRLMRGKWRRWSLWIWRLDRCPVCLEGSLLTLRRRSVWDIFSFPRCRGIIRNCWVVRL
jgi:hypothetical protein